MILGGSMTVGVKFCGGCNPSYHRGNAFEYMATYFEGKAEFAHAEVSKHYDVLLVIGGCTNKCASIEGYGYDHIIHVWSADSIEEAVKDIEKLI